MTDNQLINKIKQLKKIKPQNDWVVLCKSQILKQEEFKISFFSLFKQPAYIFSTAIMLLVIGLVGFFFLDLNREKVIETIEQQDKALPKPSQEIVLALEGLQKEIDKASETLKEIKEPQKVLEARNVVIPFIEATEKVVAELEKLELEENIKTENKILAIRTSIEEFQNTQKLSEARSARYLIDFLKTRTLTESQQEILVKAEQNYAEGNYIEALINAIFVHQIAER